MNTLEGLPASVFRHLTGYLDPRDMLRCRELSVALNNKVDENKHMLQKRLRLETIQFKDFQEFSEFVSKVTFAPFSNFKFCFDPIEVLESEEMISFVSQYGSIIWRLEIPIISLWLSKPEFEFFESMISLKELSVDWINMWSSGFDVIDAMEISTRGMNKGNPAVGWPQIPESIRNLKKFKFAHSIDGPATLMFLYGPINLASLCMGVVNIPNPAEKFTDPECTGNNVLSLLNRYLDKRNHVKSKQSSKLEFLTFSENLKIHRHVNKKLVHEFTIAAIKHKVKLQYTPASLVSSVMRLETLEEEEKEKFFNLIHNMIGMKPNHSTIYFANMDSIEICLRDFYQEDMLYEYFTNMNDNTMINLKRIVLSVQIVKSFSEHCHVIYKYWEFLFGQERNSVEEVSITARTDRNDGRLWMDPLLLVPNFHGLESLTLNLPYYHHDEFSNLLDKVADNMPTLRLLDLTLFGYIGSEVFVGTNPKNPSILRMKNLRHLRIVHQLKRTEKFAPKIDMMTDIFPLLSLTCLTIEHSLKEEIFKKTPERVAAFLNGKIAKTLRYIHWPYMHTRDCSDELDEQVKKNREGVVSIVNGDRRRCRHCENYEKDERRDQNWLQCSTIH